MIRDPSDGTVREKTVDEIAGLSSTRNESVLENNALLSSTTSGLKEPSTKSDYLARLEMSREWLRDYRNLATTTTE